MQSIEKLMFLTEVMTFPFGKAVPSLWLNVRKDTSLDLDLRFIQVRRLMVAFLLLLLIIPEAKGALVSGVPEILLKIFLFVDQFKLISTTELKNSN